MNTDPYIRAHQQRKGRDARARQHARAVPVETITALAALTLTRPDRHTLADARISRCPSCGGWCMDRTCGLCAADLAAIDRTGRGVAA